MTVTAMPKTAPPDGKAASKDGGKDGADEAKPKKSKKKLLIIVLAALLIGGGGYWFVLKPAPKGPPVPGLVVPLDAIQINLAANHYLRIGIALQLTAGVAKEDGSKADDATIAVFSGLDMSVVNDTKKREGLKNLLVKELTKQYDGEVMGVYFTEFVTQ